MFNNGFFTVSNVVSDGCERFLPHEVIGAVSKDRESSEHGSGEYVQFIIGSREEDLYISDEFFRGDSVE
jgi:hypothetical protein